MCFWPQTCRALGSVCASGSLPPNPSSLGVFSVVTGHMPLCLCDVHFIFVLILLAFRWRLSHRLLPNPSRAFWPTLDPLSSLLHRALTGSSPWFSNLAAQWHRPWWFKIMLISESLPKSVRCNLPRVWPGCFKNSQVILMCSNTWELLDHTTLPSCYPRPIVYGCLLSPMSVTPNWSETQFCHNDNNWYFH